MTNDIELHLFIYDDEVEEVGNTLRDIVDWAERNGVSDYQLGDEILTFMHHNWNDSIYEFDIAVGEEEDSE